MRGLHGQGTLATTATFGAPVLPLGAGNAAPSITDSPLNSLHREENHDL